MMSTLAGQRQEIAGLLHNLACSYLQSVEGRKKSRERLRPRGQYSNI